MSQQPRLKDFPRDLAVRVLTRVLSDGHALDEAIDGVWVATSGGRGLGPGARGWLQEVCAGTLRWKGRLDVALDSVALKKKPSGWLRKVLLIAAYQLVAQERTAAGAVVSETVAEVKRKEGEAPAKFANACLRKIADHAQSWRELALGGSTGKELAGWASLPEWLAKALVKDHGRAWLENYARASLERPTLWLRAKSADWRPTLAEGATAEQGPIAGSWRMEGAGAVFGQAGFETGEFIVQDISSQLLVAEVTKAPGVREGMRALDLCAAPGGKAVGLAWSGWDVTASDLRADRLELLHQTVARVKAPVKIASKADALAEAAYDLVWVDAPCSGSGILRRHPEVRWLRQERELPGLMKIQHELLKEGWEKVRPGGWLVYSVCSVLKLEGPEALATAGLKGSLRQEWFPGPQTAPHGDGFWAALVQKP